MMEKLPQIAEALLAGKVVLLPTDTVYGLSCLMNSQAAIERIYQIKGRDNSKAFIYLVNSWEMAEKYAILDSETRQQAAKYWPGANTLILNSCLVD
ncbi:MAG TPA: Sua5/YciO/YrdC/YwlC family protein, partial [bacterium]|nr:Sua5/YciO/YrdC/YwlC family protein [bacterium]